MTIIVQFQTKPDIDALENISAETGSKLRSPSLIWVGSNQD